MDAEYVLGKMARFLQFSLRQNFKRRIRMVRFIFVCMAIVAVSVVAMGTGFFEGISNETANIAARNVEEPVTQDIAMDAEPTAEDLNAIETTAGGDIDPNAVLKGGFTNEAPKALQEMPEASRDIPVAGPPVAQESSAN